MTTTRVTKRTRRALALRDAVLPMVKRKGVWEKIDASRRSGPGSGDMKYLTVRIGNLKICFRPSRQRVDVSLPYGLDVYAPQKVLTFGWDNEGSVVKMSLRDGAWERELLSLAKADGGRAPRLVGR